MLASVHVSVNLSHVEPKQTQVASCKGPTLAPTMLGPKQLGPVWAQQREHGPERCSITAKFVACWLQLRINDPGVGGGRRRERHECMNVYHKLETSAPLLVTSALLSSSNKKLVETSALLLGARSY